MCGTLPRECLDHVIVLNEPHGRAIRREVVAYSHADRPHRTLGLEPAVPAARAHASAIRARLILGGLHHLSERAA